MIIELLTHFEMKFPKGQQARPESIYYDMSIIPNDKADVLIKRRVGAEKSKNWSVGKKGNQLKCV